MNLSAVSKNVERFFAYYTLASFIIKTLKAYKIIIRKNRDVLWRLTDRIIEIIPRIETHLLLSPQKPVQF